MLPLYNRYSTLFKIILVVFSFCLLLQWEFNFYYAYDYFQRWCLQMILYPSNCSSVIWTTQLKQIMLQWQRCLTREEHKVVNTFALCSRWYLTWCLSHFEKIAWVPVCLAWAEERYTWILDPKDLKGNRGKHYLVVRPIVGPGIKSINASLSITSFTTACKFWNESTLEWSTFGCRVSSVIELTRYVSHCFTHDIDSECCLHLSKVGVQTTPLVIQCLCNHLTFFGSSFFVTPNLVDPSRTAELFGTFGENPVVVCFVGALFLAYLLAIVWARRKDIKDIVKVYMFITRVWFIYPKRNPNYNRFLCMVLGGLQVKVTVLADNNPMDENGYLLSVSTGYRRGASTSSQVNM